MYSDTTVRYSLQKEFIAKVCTAFYDIKAVVPSSVVRLFYVIILKKKAAIASFSELK